MNTIIKMYITLFPVIISGVFNMIFCKYKLIKILDFPIDNNKTLKNGKRIFGDNKTWNGLVGYVLINTLVYIFWGLLSKYNLFLQNNNYFYINYENTLAYNIKIGILLGLAYGLFELPNSFIKRNFGIESGKSAENRYKIIFIFFDQTDSIFGCALVVWLFYDIGFYIFLAFILIGAITHIGVNMILYSLKLRKTRI